MTEFYTQGPSELHCFHDQGPVGPSAGEASRVSGLRVPFLKGSYKDYYEGPLKGTIRGFGFGVWGFGFRVSGLGFWVLGF